MVRPQCPSVGSSFLNRFHEIENSVNPSDKYKFGYWTDILAVAPNTVETTSSMSWLENPITEVGKMLV